MEIELPLAMTGLDPWIPMPATLLFDIAPHLAGVATFAVHKEPHYDRWNVSNIETGLHIVVRTSRAAALRDAKEKLAKKTPDDFKEAYRLARSKYPQIFDGTR